MDRRFGAGYSAIAIQTALIDSGPFNRFRVRAVAERRAGELPQKVPRRMPEHGVVPVSRRSQGCHRSLAQTLQRGAPAFGPRLFDAGRVRRKASTHQTQLRFRNVPGRCAMRGASRPARCSSVLEGTIERPGDAGSSNSNVVRRIRAGHGDRTYKAAAVTAAVAVGHWIARMQARSEQTYGVLTASERRALLSPNIINRGLHRHTYSHG